MNKMPTITKILNEYGKVLELGPFHTAIAESFLPYPKDTIKAAHVAALLFASPAEKEVLKTGYMMLAWFISDEDATVVARFERWRLGLSPNHPEDEKLREQYAKIQKHIAQESEKLLKEWQILSSEIEKFDRKTRGT